MALDQLLEAVRAVYAGEQYIPPQVAMRIGERMLAQLSPREMEVLKLLARGLSNKEIAAQLGLVVGTVKIQVANIFSKLAVSDRTQALVAAVQRGIIEIASSTMSWKLRSSSLGGGIIGSIDLGQPWAPLAPLSPAPSFSWRR